MRNWSTSLVPRALKSSGGQGESRQEQAKVPDEFLFKKVQVLTCSLP